MTWVRGHTFYKNKNTNHRQGAYHLDDNVDDVPRSSLIWAREKEEEKHKALDDQLGNGLHHTIAVCDRENHTLGEHVNDEWHKHPPVTLPIGVVEDAVLKPSFLILIEQRNIALFLLGSFDSDPDLNSEESEDSCEYRKGDTGEEFCGP
jgi:hypothetical protein